MKMLSHCIYRKGYGRQSRGTVQRRGGSDICAVCTPVNSSVGLKQLSLKWGMCTSDSFET